jgi:DNA-binding GntR family transcriptional regulator
MTNTYGTLSDHAYSAIKRQLITLEIPPGAPFSEIQIALQLHISKTPVREALGRLRREGFVEVEPRAGYRAAPVTLRDTRDLFGLRLLLEVEAAGLAATNLADWSQLMRLEELCEHSYDAQDPDSIAAFLKANSEFHAGIARAAGNVRLAAVLEQVLDQLERLFRISLAITFRSDEIVHEHRDLVQAIVTGDALKARATAAAQIRAAQARVLEALLSSPIIMSLNIYAAPAPGG